MGGSKGSSNSYNAKWQSKGAQDLAGWAMANRPTDFAPRDFSGQITRENFGYSPTGQQALTGAYNQRSYTYDPQAEAQGYRNSVYNLGNRNLEQQISNQRASRSGPMRSSYDNMESQQRSDFEAQQNAGLANWQNQWKQQGVASEESRLGRIPGLLGAEASAGGLNQQAGQNFLSNLMANEQLQGTKNDSYYKYLQALNGIYSGADYNKKDIVPKTEPIWKLW